MKRYQIREEKYYDERYMFSPLMIDPQTLGAQYHLRVGLLLGCKSYDDASSVIEKHKKNNGDNIVVEEVIHNCVESAKDKRYIMGCDPIVSTNPPSILYEIITPESNHTRFNELRRAINGQINLGGFLPPSWINEYNDFISKTIKTELKIFK